jgi:signal transduction histidine kinase
MPPRRAAPSGMAVSLGRVFLGPWPIYPRAIATLVVYGMLIRGIVRALSQGPDGKPWFELLLPNGITVVVVAAVAWGGAKLLARLLTGGRARYVVVILLESLLITVALVLMVRRILPDGHSPVQPGVLPVAIFSAVMVIITVAFANGVAGFVLERFRREEELVRAERTMQLAAEERVRAETARYLHDDVQTALLRASLRLVPVAERVSDSTDREALRLAIAEIDAVRDEGVRRIGRRLAPPLSSTGLLVALSDLAASYAGVMAVHLDVDAAASERFRIVADDDRVALALYRITEQALQNALKHGQATQVDASVVMRDTQTVVLTLEADGAAPLAGSVPGDGTAIINAWLDDVGGTWTLTAGMGGGSRFLAVLEAEVSTQPGGE